MPAVFESRDPTYRGPERRTQERRQDRDRRETIRLTTADTERRQILGRRKTDRDVWQDFRS